MVLSDRFGSGAGNLSAHPPVSDGHLTGTVRRRPQHRNERLIALVGGQFCSVATEHHTWQAGRTVAVFHLRQPPDRGLTRRSGSPTLKRRPALVVAVDRR